MLAKVGDDLSTQSTVPLVVQGHCQTTNARTAYWEFALYTYMYMHCMQHVLSCCRKTYQTAVQVSPSTVTILKDSQELGNLLLVWHN